MFGLFGGSTARTEDVAVNHIIRSQMDASTRTTTAGRLASEQVKDSLLSEHIEQNMELTRENEALKARLAEALREQLRMTTAYKLVVKHLRETWQPPDEEARVYQTYVQGQGSPAWNDAWKATCEAMKTEEGAKAFNLWYWDRHYGKPTQMPNLKATMPPRSAH